MTRMMVMTFWGSERFREAHAEDEHAHDNAHHESHVHEPHESPWLMTAPLIVLALLSTVGGLIGVPYALSSMFRGHPENYIEQTLDPVIAKTPGSLAEVEHQSEVDWQSKPPPPHDGAPAFAPLDEHTEVEGIHSADEVREERLLALLSVMIALLGITTGWLIFKKRPLLQLPRILENKYYVDEIYDAAIINPIKVGSREGLWKLFDVGVIDGFLHSVGDAVTETGRAVRHLQAGFVRGYAAIILLGALAVVAVFAYYGVYALKP
jgi:NADH-quinone oxidoreductase subunit L